MKIYSKALLLAAATVLAACAENPPAPPPPDNGPAHEASVRELIEVTQGRKMMDAAGTQADAMMQAGLKQALGNQTLTAEQQAIVDDMRSRTVTAIKEQLNWDTLEPQVISMYEQTFTEQEMQGMLAFYRTDAGKAVIAKMPLVMQKAMQMVQQQMLALMPKLQAIERDCVARLKATQSGDAQHGATQAPAGASAQAS